MCLVYKWSGRLSLRSVNDRWQEGHPLENLKINIYFLFAFTKIIYNNKNWTVINHLTV